MRGQLDFEADVASKRGVETKSELTSWYADRSDKYCSLPEVSVETRWGGRKDRKVSFDQLDASRRYRSDADKSRTSWMKARAGLPSGASLILIPVHPSTSRTKRALSGGTRAQTSATRRERVMGVRRQESAALRPMLTAPRVVMGPLSVGEEGRVGWW